MLFTNSRAILLAVLLPLTTQAQAKDNLAPLFGPPNRGEISSLPDIIKKQASLGKATLYADFQNVADNQVQVYLLNPTKKTIQVLAQDGSLYSKREVFAPDDVWRRCDGHRFSDCGNSYGGRAVPQGEFVSWSQTLNSSSGVKSRVRFRLYQPAPNDFVSNEGEATVAADEILQCRYDVLAMQTAPFEDVAALATGAVTVRQDEAQWQDPEEAAVRALERFAGEEAWTETLQTVLERARVAETARRNESGNDADNLTRSASRIRYQSALQILIKSPLYYPGRSDLWFHLEGQYRDRTNPWSDLVLQTLLSSPYSRGQELRPLLELALTTPNHAALETALRAIPKAYGKAEASSLLKAATANEKYPAAARLVARGTFEREYANPFVSLTLEHQGQENHATPIKRLTITNISPQKIRLPVRDLQKLLIVRVTLNDSQEFATATPKMDSLSQQGEVVLEPGQSAHLSEVKWWEMIKLPRPFPSKSINLSFAFATPGLWEVPALASTSYWLDDERLQGVLSMSPP
jgi:hypothetical protein